MVTNIDNSNYKDALDRRSQLQSLFMVLKSLEATPGLEWEKVKKSDPNTWKFVDEELGKAFTIYGAGRIVQGVARANGLDERMLQEARTSFLASAPVQ